MLEGSAGCKGSNLGSQQGCAQHSMKLAATQHGSSQHLHRHGQTLPPIIKGQPAADLSGNSQDQLLLPPALQDLLLLTGGIDAARPSADGYNGFERALESCRQHGLEHEVLSAEEVNRRFPGYQLPPDMQVRDKPSAELVTQGCSCLYRAVRAHAPCRGGQQTLFSSPAAP